MTDAIETINKRLAAAGATPAELAALSGVSYGTTCAIIRGMRKRPIRSTVEKLLDASLLLKGERRVYDRAMAMLERGHNVVDISAELRIDTARVRRWAKGGSLPRGLRRLSK